MSRYRKVALAALGFTLLVILWGAFVRISGSGAGCGSHWPTCNGDVIPRSPKIATVIELTHRVTSFTALVLVGWQLVEAFRSFPKGHLARRAAVWSVVFMLSEALVGAGLVLFEMVAQNKSVARGYWVGLHLTNTFFLIGAMAVANWAAIPRDPDDSFASSDVGPPAIDTLSRERLLALFGAGAFGIIVVGITGAIAALGDALFPVTSLAEGLSQDVARHAHIFVKLRGLHPFAAVLVGTYVIAVAAAFARSARPSVQRAANRLGIAVATQLGVGVLNLLMLAPAVVQIFHLLAADLVWISLIVLASSTLSTASRGDAGELSAAPSQS